MSNPGQIIVGVDGSECSVAALRWAAGEARLRGAHLVVLHAWRVPDVGLPGLAPPYPDAEFEAYANQVLDYVTGAVPDLGVAAEWRSVQGHAAQVLVDASEEADLLVVGSRGHGGVAGTLLGSVSQRVTTHAHCPVVVVRGCPEPGGVS